ncbi:MAG: hypothetical protein RLN70_06870, partial [Rhodospirillaceae bacterium]
MFIEEYPGAVAPDLCERIIERFEADPRRAPSKAYVAGQAAENSLRTGTHLVCETTGEWGEFVRAVVPAFESTLDQYARKYPALMTVINA